MSLFLEPLPLTSGQKHTRRGFSLLELSIVITIMGLLMGGALTLSTAKTEQNHMHNTHEELEVINDAISVFVNENGRMPCPASLLALRGDAEFGREASDCADSTPPTGVTYTEYPASSGNYVRIGGVPFYSLGLPSRFLGDDWNNRYHYAVIDGAISSITSSSTGHIRVNEENGTAISEEVVWVVFSTGKTAKGAFTEKTATTGTACDATEIDGENCDRDGLFVDGVFNDGDIAANRYDDFIHWETVEQLFNIQSFSAAFPTCSAGETIEYDGSDWVCATSGGGASLPSCSSGQTIEYNGSSWVCSTPSGGGGLLSCSPGQMMLRTGGGWSCWPYSGGSTLPSCPAGQYAVSVGGGTWSCASAPSGGGLPSCPAGQYTVSAGGGSWSCASAPSGGSLPSCSAGEIIEYNGSSWVCITTPSGGGGGSLPSCSAGEIIEYNGSSWVCITTPSGGGGGSLPSCSAGEIIEYDGSNWVCITTPSGGGSSLPSCSVGQIIEYDGSNWVCATPSAGASLPSCSAGEIMEYDGSDWVCSTTIRTLPTCTSGQLLEYNGSSWVCADPAEAASFPSCTTGQTIEYDGSDWVCADPSTSYAPSAMRVTTSTHNGNFGSYAAMQSWIESNGCNGYRVCTTTDFISYAQENMSGSFPITTEAIIIGFTGIGFGGNPFGPSTFPPPPEPQIIFSDCNLYTSASSSDDMAVFIPKAGVIGGRALGAVSYNTCDQLLPVACCQF